MPGKKLRQLPANDAASRAKTCPYRREPTELPGISRG
jgi:hypothetical protein